MINFDIHQSDRSVQYRYHRDILKSDIKVLETIQQEMIKHGWGHTLMSFQMDDAYWTGYYSSKWIGVTQ